MKVFIYHWMGRETSFKEGVEYDLSIEQIISLSDTYDVMIRSVNKAPRSTKKKQYPPEMVKRIYLDDIGGIFRQR